MKTTMIELVNKLKDINRLISKLGNHEYDSQCDLDDAVGYLEEYRDLILSREVNF